MRIKIIVLFISAVLHQSCSESDDFDSYSFHKFRGPVSGEVQEIVVPSAYPDPYNHNQYHQTLDYHAKPDYLYSYGVQDPKTGNSQAHQETRDGDAVKGEYRVLQADGMVRVVKYTADGENGFKASVHYENA